MCCKSDPFPQNLEVGGLKNLRSFLLQLLSLDVLCWKNYRGILCQEQKEWARTYAIHHVIALGSSKL